MTALPFAPAVPEAVSHPSGPESTLISVLVLVTERPQELVEFYRELVSVVRDRGKAFEFVFMVEPPHTDSIAPLAELVSRGEPVRIISVGQARGETSLLRVGVPHCRGSIILTVPCARRVETSTVGQLINAVEAGADLAVARRWPRRDPWIIRAQTRLFHAVAAHIVGGAMARISDVACGVRAMRREILERIPLYGDLALFLPLLALRDGYVVRELAAPQHVANRRTRLHSPVLYLRRLFDLLGLFFLVRFTDKPLRFFGSAGTAVLLPGAAILAVVFVQRLGGQGVADRPLLLLGVLLVVLGIQAIALGLIGEIMVHLHAVQRPSYRVKEEAQSQEPRSAPAGQRCDLDPARGPVLAQERDEPQYANQAQSEIAHEVARPA